LALMFEYGTEGLDYQGVFWAKVIGVDLGIAIYARYILEFA